VRRTAVVWQRIRRHPVGTRHPQLDHVFALLALEARDRAAANLLVGYVILLLAAITQKVHPRLG
jgi:hypothetical protein